MNKHLLRWAATLTTAFATTHQFVEHAHRTRSNQPTEHRNDDAGYTTETVIITALLAGAAITIAGILIAKVIAKANSITL
jgi:hypothetical protein